MSRILNDTANGVLKKKICTEEDLATLMEMNSLACEGYVEMMDMGYRPRVA
jgi:hypothetical protein